MSAEPTVAKRGTRRASRTPPRREPEVVRPQARMALGAGPLRTINWIDYGWPGCGKTVLLGTAQKGLFLDCDSGGSDAAAEQGSTCDVEYVNNYKELTEAFEYLRYEEGCKVYDWVFWDSVTLFMDRSLYDDVLLEAHDRNPEKQSRDVASQREYLVQQNRIGSFFRDFCDLPINFAATAHVMIEEAPETEALIYLPLIPGKRGTFAQKVMGYANIVTYHGQKDGVQRLITKQNRSYAAKDRFHALRTGKQWHVDNPTVPKIEALIEKRRKAKGSDEDQDQDRQGVGPEGDAVRRLRGPARRSVRRQDHKG